MQPRFKWARYNRSATVTQSYVIPGLSWVIMDTRHFLVSYGSMFALSSCDHFT